jgi:hypothetical protein
LYEETLTLARVLDNKFLTSELLSDRGRAQCRDGKMQSAHASLVEGLTIAAELADPQAVVEALEGFAELAVAQYTAKRAARILGAAGRLREVIGLAPSVHEEREHKRVTAAAHAALSDAAFDRTWRRGREMSLDEAVRNALSDQDTVDKATERPLSGTS